MASNTETARSAIILDARQAKDELKELQQLSKVVKQEMKELKLNDDKDGYEAKKKELDDLNLKIKSLKTNVEGLNASKVTLDGKAAGMAISDISHKLRELKKERLELKLKGDIEGANKVSRQIGDLEKELTHLRRSAADVNTVLNNLSGSSLKELTRMQNTLQAEIRNSTRNTREEVEALKAKGEQLKKVKAEIEKVRTEMLGMNGNQSFFSRMADGFNRYFAIVTAFVATFSGVIFSFKKAVDAYNEFEKTVDNLSALTGLAGDELQYLSDQAKELSTSTIEGSIRITQSAQDIVNAYTKVGSARPELLKNKEALNAVTQDAIILSEAANEKLQPSIEGLTMVLNQFNLPASESRRVINALAAGSKVGAAEIPYLTTAVEKSGTVAADAKISIETLIGTIETLAPRISEPEIAGRTLKGVLLDLQKGAEDTNPALVGMEKALDNLAAKNLSTVELLKMFGTENITTAKILINNREELKNYTAAVTDTNVAIEQATTNTDNNASRLAQAKNKFQNVTIYLGEKLSPAMTTSTNIVTHFIKAVVVLIDTFQVWGPMLFAATAGVLAYNVVVNGAAAVTWLYKRATDAAKWATDLFSKSLKTNPFGLIASLLATAITYLISYERKLSAVELAQKALNDVTITAKKSIADEKLQLELLLGIAKNEKKSKEDRMKAITALNELSPAYLGNLKLETINTNEAKEATEKYIASLERAAKTKAAQDKLAELEGQLIELASKDKRVETTFLQDIGTAITSMGNAQVAMLQTVKKERANYKEEEAKIIAQKNKLLGIVEEQISAEDILGTKIVTTTKSTAAANKNLGMSYDELSQKISETEKLLKNQLALKDPLAKETAKELQNLTRLKDEIDKKASGYTKAKEKEKDAYEKLTAAIAEQEALLHAQIAEGDPNIQATIDRINVLKSEKDQIDSVYNAYMDLLQLPKSESLDDLIKWAEEQDNMDTAKLLQQTEILIKKNKKLGDSYVDDQEKKKKNAEETIKLREKQIASSFEAGAAAVEEAKTVEEAGKAVLNSIRQQIKAAIAEAIAMSVANVLKNALIPFPFNIALATAAGAAASLLFETIIPQFGTGRYEVTGAQDGKRYQAEWAGVPVTGLYTRPSLIAETGSEIIIDPYRTRNIMMNYPYLLEAIKSVPQHASGTVPAGPGQMMFPAELTAVLMQLSDQLGKGIKAKMVYSEFQDIKDRVDSIENSVKTR